MRFCDITTVLLTVHLAGEMNVPEDLMHKDLSVSVLLILCMKVFLPLLSLLDYFSISL